MAPFKTSSIRQAHKSNHRCLIFHVPNPGVPRNPTQVPGVAPDRQPHASGRAPAGGRHAPPGKPTWGCAGAADTDPPASTATAPALPAGSGQAPARLCPNSHGATWRAQVSPLPGGHRRAPLTSFGARSCRSRPGGPGFCPQALPPEGPAGATSAVRTLRPRCPSLSPGLGDTGSVQAFGRTREAPCPAEWKEALSEPRGYKKSTMKDLKPLPALRVNDMSSWVNEAALGPRSRAATPAPQC